MTYPTTVYTSRVGNPTLILDPSRGYTYSLTYDSATREVIVESQLDESNGVADKALYNFTFGTIRKLHQSLSRILASTLFDSTLSPQRLTVPESEYAWDIGQMPTNAGLLDLVDLAGFSFIEGYLGWFAPGANPAELGEPFIALTGTVARPVWQLYQVGMPLTYVPRPDAMASSSGSTRTRTRRQVKTRATMSDDRGIRELVDAVYALDKDGSLVVDALSRSSEDIAASKETHGFWTEISQARELFTDYKVNRRMIAALMEDTEEEIHLNGAFTFLDFSHKELYSFTSPVHHPSLYIGVEYIPQYELETDNLVELKSFCRILQEKLDDYNLGEVFILRADDGERYSTTRPRAIVVKDREYFIDNAARIYRFTRDDVIDY